MRFISTLLLIVATVFAAQGQDFIKAKIKHRGAESVAYSPDAQFIALNSFQDVVVYSAATGVPFKTLNGLTSKATKVAFSPDGLKIMATSSDGKILVWTIESGQVDTRIAEKGDIRSAVFLSNEQIIYASGDWIKLYNVSKKQVVWSVPFKGKNLRALATNGKYVAAGGSDNLIYLFNSSDGALTTSLTFHSNWIRSLAFHPSKPLLASGADNGQVAIWDLENFQRQGVLEDVNGRIYGLKFSTDGSVLVYGGASLHVYNLDRKYSVFNETKLYSSIIDLDISPDGQSLVSLEDLGTIFKIWNISSLNISPVYTAKDDKDKTPPQIYISEPANIRDERVRVAVDLLAIKGSVFDNAGVRSLKINGIETPVKNNGSFVINTPLSFGENYISIETSDINGNIALRKFVVDRQNIDGTSYDPSKAKNHLFIVGINDYQHWPKLNNAVKDISDITTILLSKYNFEFENVVMLKNEQATRANIVQGLRQLIEKLSPQDNLIIYFSGHGYFDQLLNEGYWVPVEAKKDISDYIPNSMILKIVDNINTQHTFLVADACFSGALFTASTRGYVENVEKYKSRWGLTSGRLEVVSDGQQGVNSPFAGHFISFLQTNNNRRFAVSELVQYVKIKTAENSNQTPLGNPIKSLGDEGGEFIFYQKK